MHQFLNLFLDTSEAGMQFVIASLLVAGGYSLYWFTSHSSKAIDRLSGGSVRSQIRVTWKRLLGFFWMGLIPFLVVWLIDFPVSLTGLGPGWDGQLWIWLAVLVPLILLINFLSAGKEENLKQYPQIREQKWTTRTFLLEYAGWTLYLLGYEFLFRGVFFFGIIPFLGEGPAIVLNAAVYSLAHIPKGARETIGSIVFGFFICYASIIAGSIWFAVLLHLVLALSNSVFSFGAHPEMGIHGKD